MSNDNLDLREDLLKAIGNPFPKNSLSNSLINLHSIEICINGFERFLIMDILRGISVFYQFLVLVKKYLKKKIFFLFLYLVNGKDINLLIIFLIYLFLLMVVVFIFQLVRIKKNKVNIN